MLPRERGIMDRMLDYLVGDGPANRYALICCQCQSHNGMALKEEFEFLGKRPRSDPVSPPALPSSQSLSVLSYHTSTKLSVGSQLDCSSGMAVGVCILSFFCAFQKSPLPVPVIW